MKLIDQSRLIAAHDKVTKFAYRLTHQESEVMKAAFAYGFKSAFYEQTKAVPEPTKERDVLRLTCDYHEVFTLKDSLDLEARFRRKIDRIRLKRDRLDAIQQKYQISGLHQAERKLGDAVIERWYPADEQLDLLDGDLDLLMSDRARVVRFWMDHVLLNGLTPYRRDENDNWVATGLNFCSLCSTEYDWADVWQDLIWIKRTRRNIPVGCAVPLETSRTEKGGYLKHHEIHIRLGDGKHWEDPERSIWFCACNERPFN